MQTIDTAQISAPDGTHLSGPLGIVVIPDARTIEESYALASQILPSTSEYQLSPGSLPHLTLYHGKLVDVPVGEARHLVDNIRDSLCGKRFLLGPIVAYGGNFIFWNVERNAESSVLHDAHIKALDIAKFLDRRSEAKATSEEGLTLSQAELDNVKQYGHPLVKQLCNPHITLGFNRGISHQFPASQHKKFEFTVDSVELVKIGYPGRVEGVLELTNASEERGK